jgi:AbrB family looped-hinge helix DNA binding protein
MNKIRVRVSSSGRVGIPADVRRAMGLEEGGVVTMEMDGNDLRIRTLREGVARAQALVRQIAGDSEDLWSDELIAERRREAAKE